MGDDSTLFITLKLKRYTLSKYQSIFGPLRRLPRHILESIGLDALEVKDHIEVTDGIDPYHSSPPHPSQAILFRTKTKDPSSTAVPILT